MIYPRLIFSSQEGWEVIQSSETEFRLLDWAFGYIATFGSLAAAVNYMKQEFL